MIKLPSQKSAIFVARFQVLLVPDSTWPGNTTIVINRNKLKHLKINVPHTPTGYFFLTFGCGGKPQFAHLYH